MGVAEEVKPDPHYVDRDQLVRWSGEAMRRSPDPRAGLFGRESMLWHVGRESITFLGAGRAALLQLAHPWVANAIDQHSATAHDPIGRFRRTFTNVFTMVYGSVDQVERAVNRVHGVHTRIHGHLNEDSGAFDAGSYYQANEAHAMLWVHATLWDTALRMYELVYPSLTAEQRETYYRETKLFAHLFGIPDELLPSDWQAFQRYCDSMYASDVLTVADTGRRMGAMLFELDLPMAGWPLQWLKLMTAMPERLREDFGLPSPEGANRRRIDRSLRWIRRVHPRLPPAARYIPPYLEARRRLQGRLSSITTRTLNRLWLGRPELVSE